MKSEADIEVEKSPNRVKKSIDLKNLTFNPKSAIEISKLPKSQKITLIKKSQTQLFTHITPVKQH